MFILQVYRLSEERQKEKLELDKAIYNKHILEDKVDLAKIGYREICQKICSSDYKQNISDIYKIDQEILDEETIRNTLLRKKLHLITMLSILKNQ